MRNRLIYAIAVIVVIILGLASRSYLEYLPTFLAAYAGDTLWALMVFLIIGFIFKNKSVHWVWCTAMIFSYLIELSQLYQTEWINTIRHTVIGGLILGCGFLWSDLICYTVGITIGGAIEKVYQKQHFNGNKKELGD